MTDEDDSPPQPYTITRQEERMAALPAVYKTPYEQMACELAIGIDSPEDVFRRYGYTAEQGDNLLMNPEFARVLDRISQEVRTSGLSFKTKVKMQAEALLGHAYEIASDPLQPTSERVKLIVWHAKLSGYEPKESDEKGKGSGGGLNLSITFSGQAPVKVVSSEPQLIENETE